MSEVHDPKRRDTQQQETYTTINHEQAPISDSEETGKRMRLNWKQWDGILVDGGRREVVWFYGEDGRMWAFLVCFALQRRLTPP